MAVKLTSKQQRWCDEYLIDLNATQAAIRAGYSQKTAKQIGAENLSKPVLMAVVAAAKQKRSEETEIDAAEVLRLLHAQVTADPNDIYDDDGKLLPISQWPEGWRLLLNSLDVGADGTVRARFSDRARLISLLGKHCDVGAYEKVVKVDANDNLVSYLEAAAKRVREMREPPSPGVLPDSRT